MGDFSELTPDAQTRIKAKEAAVDQLLHEVRTSEDLLRKLDWLDDAAQFTVDATGASFEREHRRTEARETRRLFLKEAARVLFESIAEEHWSALAPDAETFIQRLPKIADYVLTRGGRNTEVVQETEKRMLEWKGRAYQALADREAEAAPRPGVSRSKGRGPAYQKITQFKSKHRITDERLAEKMGIDRSTLYTLKKGEPVSEMTCHRAASVLGCDPSELKPKR